MSCCRAGWLSHAGEFAPPGVSDHYAPDLGLEPSHLDVRLRLDVDARRADGEVTTTAVARGDDARRLRLDAVDLLAVAVDDPDGRPLRWSYDGRRIDVTWEQAPAPGEARRVRVRYRVERPRTGLLFSAPDAADPGRARYAITDHETERARYWLPCLDHPTVRTTLELRLTVPAAWECLANGARVGHEDHPDGTRTTTWRLDHPCPSYLICFAAGELVRHEQGTHAGVPVAAFAPAPYGAAELERSFGPTGAMLEWMTARLGVAFPFPKYYQVAVPQIGGAMENISLVTWDDSFLLDEALASEWRHLVDRVNVHEMAHSWFGDAVVIRDFAHAWLKESWATYMEAVWTEEHLGVEEARYLLHQDAQAYMEEADERYARPIVTRRFGSSWEMFDRHLYPGGAWRIHMLRARVGERAFWSAVTAYLRAHGGRVVETDDFRRALEEACGLSLGRFFDQWLRSPGYPRLKASWEFDEARREGKLTVEQTQRDEARGVGLFELELELGCELGEGEWRTVRLQVSEARHVFVVPLPSRPLQVVVDPEMRLLCGLEFDPGQDLLLRTLQRGPSLKGQLHAVQTLGGSGRAAAVAALREAGLKAGFWGLRVEVARALGRSLRADAAAALAELLAAERDPRALSGVAEACAQMREPVLAEALRAFLDRQGLPWLARAAALRALGSQRDPRDLERLQAASRDGSWWGWVRRGAATGLGRTREAGALPRLLELIRPGAERSQIRQAAAQALAELARWQETGPRERVRDALIDLTRDADYKVRQAAGGALGALGDPAASRALLALADSLAEQDAPRIRRQAAGLVKGGEAGGPGEKLTKLVETLGERVRTLEARLQTLESRQSPPSGS